MDLRQDLLSYFSILNCFSIGFKDIKDLPQHILDEIKHFFTVYKQLEHGKETVIEGIHGAKMAKEAIAEARARYDAKFPDKK